MPRWLREIRWALEFLLAWPVLTLVRVMTPYWFNVTVTLAGRGAYFLLARERKWALLNLRLVFGDNLDERQRQRLAICSFENQARWVCEILRIDRRWIKRHVIMEGMEYVPGLFAAGSGVLAVAGHLGNPEIFAGAFAERGIPCAMMSRPLENPHLERYLLACRRRYGTRSSRRDRGGIRDVLRLLASNEGFGIAIDQNATSDAVFVDFFGIPASTARGPAALALRSGCSVTMLVALRQGDGRHRIIITPAFPVVRSGDKERDICENLQMFTRGLERFIEQYPEQYRWGYGRWARAPARADWRCDDRYEQLVKHRRGEARMPPLRWRRKESER